MKNAYGISMYSKQNNFIISFYKTEMATHTKVTFGNRKKKKGTKNHSSSLH
jgi:hypothetical protein